jgi:hypothetical protein
MNLIHILLKEGDSLGDSMAARIWCTVADSI